MQNKTFIKHQQLTEAYTHYPQTVFSTQITQPRHSNHFLAQRLSTLTFRSQSRSHTEVIMGR